MTDYRIDESYRRNDAGFSSLGVESKYYKDGYWYKQDISGYEGLAEEVCSMVLRHSNIESYVEYEACTINGRSGCRSRNFLKEGESIVTFKRLYETANGGNLADHVYAIRDVNERIQFVTDFVKEYAEIDCTGYLRDILSFDMLVLNTDRHFHNLALIRSDTGYRECPIFDNGASLLSYYGMFPPGEELEEQISCAAAKPFSGSFEQQAVVLGTEIRLDYDAIYEELEKIKHVRLRAALEYQLKRYRKFFASLPSGNCQHVPV